MSTQKFCLPKTKFYIILVVVLLIAASVALAYYASSASKATSSRAAYKSKVSSIVLAPSVAIPTPGDFYCGYKIHPARYEKNANPQIILGSQCPENYICTEGNAGKTQCNQNDPMAFFESSLMVNFKLFEGHEMESPYFEGLQLFLKQMNTSIYAFDLQKSDDKKRMYEVASVGYQVLEEKIARPLGIENKTMIKDIYSELVISQLPYTMFHGVYGDGLLPIKNAGYVKCGSVLSKDFLRNVSLSDIGNRTKTIKSEADRVALYNDYAQLKAGEVFHNDCRYEDDSPSTVVAGMEQTFDNGFTMKTSSTIEMMFVPYNELFKKKTIPDPEITDSPTLYDRSIKAISAFVNLKDIVKKEFGTIQPKDWRGPSPTPVPWDRNNRQDR